MKNISGKLFGILCAIGVILLYSGSKELMTYNDAGNVLFIQYPSGSLGVFTDQGYKWRWFGTTETWRKSNQFWFSNKRDQGETRDQSVKIRFSDNGHAQLSGSSRYDLPTDEKKLGDLYATFKTQKAFETDLIRPNIEKSIYMTGSLMTSKDSSASKRPDLLHYIEDQAALGIYRTTTKEVTQTDELTKESHTVTVVDIVQDLKDANGFARQEESSFVRFGIHLYNMAIDDIVYDPAVEKQIAAQREATMQIQTAIAESKQAEQAAATAEAKGKATAATAKWEQETINAKSEAEAENKKAIAVLLASQQKEVAVTEAEQKKAVAELALEAAKSEAEAVVTKATAEAQGKKLILEANGALQEKLEAIVKIAEVQANAISQYKGNLVPSVVMGGSGSTPGTAQAGSPDLLNTYLQMQLARSVSAIGLDMTIPASVQKPTGVAKE